MGGRTDGRTASGLWTAAAAATANTKGKEEERSEAGYELEGRTRLIECKLGGGRRLAAAATAEGHILGAVGRLVGHTSARVPPRPI